MEVFDVSVQLHLDVATIFKLLALRYIAHIAGEAEGHFPLFLPMFRDMAC